jgi:hypothetical protein
MLLETVVWTEAIAVPSAEIEVEEYSFKSLEIRRASPAGYETTYS